MIGLAKSQSVGSIAIPLNYRVELNPGGVFTPSTNGSSTSSSIYSTVTDGVGPVFTYAWTIDNPSITIIADNNSNTRFQASGFNESVEGIATLTVTDTGNGNAETSDTATVQFEFGQ